MSLPGPQPRSGLPFRAVNRAGRPGYDEGLQRHHLLPRQLLRLGCFAAMFEALGRDRVGFDDFRANGLLLPSSESAAVRFGLPLHRGPHRCYNAMAIERVGRIEAAWSERRRYAAEAAADEALMRLVLLQRALRRRLLDPARRRYPLSRRDPAPKRADFTDLDAMADALWGATEQDQTLTAIPARSASSRFAC